jgi:hypothetical protein
MKFGTEVSQAQLMALGVRNPLEICFHENTGNPEATK